MGIDDFDHIIKDKLSGFESTPPPRIAENIRFDLLAGKKLGSVEQAPPPHLWDKIASALRPKKAVFFTRWRIAATVALLLSASGLFVLLNADKTTQPNTEIASHIDSSQNAHAEKTSDTEAMVQTVTPEAQDNSQINTSESGTYQAWSNPENQEPQETSPISEPSGSDLTQINQVNNPQQQQNQSSPEINHQPQEMTPETSDFHQTDIKENYVVQNNTNDTEVHTPVLQTPELEAAIALQNPSNTPVKENGNITVNIPNTILNDTADKVTPDVALEHGGSEEQQDNNNIAGTDNDQTSDNPIIIKPNPRNLQQISLSLKYAPDMVNVSEWQGYRHGLNFGFHYQNSSLIIESGLGASYLAVKDGYELKYEKNEYATTNYVIDQLGFSPTGDPIVVEGHYEDSYHDVKYQVSAEATNHFISLSIPLLAGYQLDYRDYSLYAKGGILYSYNIYKHTSNVYDPGENSTILKFEYEDLSLRKSQFEYLVAVGGNTDINRNLKFSAELLGRWSQFDFFENNNQKAYGLGARIGFIYEL